METKDFIINTLERIQNDTNAVLDGLTQEEITWQPADDLNSIGLILFHTARSEDFFIQELVCQRPQIFERAGWTKHFDMPVEERGRHYRAEQVNAFVPPDINDIRKYFAEVRTQTLEYVRSLKPEDYDREVTTPRGTNTVHGFLTNIINHSAQHTGEISYLRGLKRGLNQ